jgi:hypothetical protein
VRYQAALHPDEELFFSTSEGYVSTGKTGGGVVGGRRLSVQGLYCVIVNLILKLTIVGVDLIPLVTHNLKRIILRLGQP